MIRAGLAGALLLVAPAVITGCESHKDIGAAGEFNIFEYPDRPPLSFDLARIEIVERPVAQHADDVDGLFIIPPALALKSWAEKRLQADGNDGVLRVVVEEASAKATPLATNVDLEGLFTEEQAERVDVRLRVTIEAIDEGGTVRGSATADTVRSRTLPEGLTLTERQRLYDEIVGALIHDYDTTQELAIRQYLHRYLR